MVHIVADIPMAATLDPECGEVLLRVALLRAVPQFAVEEYCQQKG